MATVAYERETTIRNPARRKRKMSDKQIAIFGTRAQKAALRRRKSSARKAAAPKAPKRRPKTRKNAYEIVSVLGRAAAANPAKQEKKQMAKSRRRRASSSHTKHHRRRRSTRTNPAPRVRTRTRTKTVIRYRTRKNAAYGRRRHYRRNPSVRNVSGFLGQAAWLIAGAVGSKAVVQMFLGNSNTGWVGYAANLAASFAIGKVVGTLTKNKQAENAAILGGVGQVVLRFLIDQTPYGSTLQKYGLGDYQFQSFVYPQRLKDGLNSAEIDIPAAWRPQPVMITAAQAAGATSPGMNGIRSVGKGLY